MLCPIGIYLIQSRRLTADHMHCLFIYIFSVWKNKITLTYTKKLFELLGNNCEIANRIICNLGKVEKGAPNLKWSFCSHIPRWRYRDEGISSSLSMLLSYRLQVKLILEFKNICWLTWRKEHSCFCQYFDCSFQTRATTDLSSRYWKIINISRLVFDLLSSGA